MKKEKIKQINSEVQTGNFSIFNSLSESEKIEIMKTWDCNLWVKFRMRNTVSEQEVFEPIFKMIDEEDFN